MNKRLKNPIEYLVAKLFMQALILFLLVFLTFPILMIFARSFFDSDNNFKGFNLFYEVFSSESIYSATMNSIFTSTMVVIITVPLAYMMAYALNRSMMPFKGAFKLIVMIPLLSPSMLSALAFIQIFGNQGFLKSVVQFFGYKNIYGVHGIIISEIYNTFPHAMLILMASLSLADKRLYEVADSLRTSKLRKLLTITIPSTKYGIISACTVVFVYVISDFGAPAVIGGNYHLLAIDVYKEVIGLNNFGRGAIIGLILLIPAVISFFVDVYVSRRTRSMSADRAVQIIPKRNIKFDIFCLSYATLVAMFFLGILGVAVWSSFITLWPYDLSLTWANYEEALFDGDTAGSFTNSLILASSAAIIGTLVVYLLAYFNTKISVVKRYRGFAHFMAVISMAVPGLVLGLGYILFFNHPYNPFNFLYGSMFLMVCSVIVHYFTSGYLTSRTVLGQIDSQYEAISQSLKVPFFKTLIKVTAPISLPQIFDIGRYFFVTGMTTVSGIIFIYSPHTLPAAVAIVRLNEASTIGAATALASAIVATSVFVCAIYALLTNILLRRTQKWRSQ